MKYLDQYIAKSGSLGQIRLAARELNRLTTEIRKILPADATHHLVGCALHPPGVVVFADSAAWASQFRYLQQDILRTCRHVLGESCTQVQFRILPPLPGTGKPPAPSVNDDARQLLRQAAAGIADDELAAALRRLSANRVQDAD